jgi:lauroyl/myristoyl acyltransferase
MLTNLGYFFYRLGEAIAVRLPMRWAYRLAEVIAWLYWIFHRRSRAMLLINLRHVLGSQASEATVRRTARRGFDHFAYGVVDFFRQPRLLGGELADLIVSVRGESYLQEAKASGRGGILMIAHMGPWEAGGAWIGTRGISFTGVALSHDGRIEDFFLSRRERSGYRTVPLGRGARGLLRALQRGEMIVVAADRNLNEFGREVLFFGQPARMPDGHVRIALRTGVPILPAFLVRREDMGVEIMFEPPIVLDPEKDDVDSGMRRCLDLLERYIWRWPEQWMAFSPIWLDDDQAQSAGSVATLA